MTSTIQLPANFTGDLATNSGAFFAQLSPFTLLIMGTLLAVLVAGILISFLHK